MTRTTRQGGLANAAGVAIIATALLAPPLGRAQASDITTAIRPSLCEGLDASRCDELGRLIAELTQLATDEQRWTPIGPGSAPLDAINDASRTARLVDEDQWPAGSQVSQHLLGALKSALEEHVDRRTKAWEDEYFEHLKWYNAARKYRHDLEAINAERTALETSLRHSENRIRILEGLFFQSIAGIGTGIVVMGHETWNERHTITDFRNRIVERLGQVAGIHGGPKLVFSYSEVRDGQLLTDLVEQYRGGRVEAFESDPYCISDRSEHHCAQMFRVYPELVRSDALATPELADAAGVDLGSARIVDSLSDPTFLNDYLADSDESRAVIGTMLERVAAYNRRSVATLAEVESKYRREISANQAYRRSLEERLADSSRRREALVAAVEADISLEHATVRAEVDARTVDSLVATWVRARADLLDRFLSHRDYVAYTVRREFLHAGQLSDDLRRALVADALDKLEERRRHFLTRRFARVDAGVLQDYTIEEYYQEGRIVSFLLPLYLRSYPQRAQGGGTETQESMLLALRISFDQRQGGPVTPAPSDRRLAEPESAGAALASCEPAAGTGDRFAVCADTGFVRDRERGLIWAAGAVAENVLFRQFERQTEALGGLGARGWRLPTVDELRSLAGAPRATLWRIAGPYWSDEARGSGMDVRVTTVWLPSGTVDDRAADNIATGIAVLDVD